MNLVFITMRIGSNGIKKKNIKSIAKKPLFYWSVSEYDKCDNIDKIYLLIDSKEIEKKINLFDFKKNQ